MIKEIPTGKIFTINGEKGYLEALSIGDYGKSRNIKADFLGFHNKINGVCDGNIKPLSEKWVITISTQYGCIQKCKFCDVPKVKFKGNATMKDMLKQIDKAILLNPDTKYTDRLNLHFARMGEPSFNSNVIDIAKAIYFDKVYFYKKHGLRIETIHPVVSTCMPNSNRNLEEFLYSWCYTKNKIYNGQAGLQISLNSTDNNQRNYLFNKGSLEIEKISRICDTLPDPIGRKYCLNFAVTQDTMIDAKLLSKMFNSENFMCKITPIHNCLACKSNSIKTKNGYTSYAPYENFENDLKENGFDVLVFVPSFEEENNFVTCGNLCLSEEDI